MKALGKLRVAFDLSIVNPSYVILVSHSHKVVDFVVVSSEEDSGGLWRCSWKKLIFMFVP